MDWYRLPSGKVGRITDEDVVQFRDQTQTLLQLVTLDDDTAYSFRQNLTVAELSPDEAVQAAMIILEGDDAAEW